MQFDPEKTTSIVSDHAKEHIENMFLHVQHKNKKSPAVIK